MSSALTAINEVVTRRIAQLKTGIAEAEATLARYREEIALLLKVTQVTGAGAPAAAAIPAPVTEPVPPSRNRYNPYRLPPRYQRAVNHFAEWSKPFTREDIAGWYRRAVNPKILPRSLAVEICNMTRLLTARGFITPHDEGSWKIVP